ncbi:MAG: tRNA 2-selenouridine(34) synthase MnmH [Granulosicoccus sp.]
MPDMNEGHPQALESGIEVPKQPGASLLNYKDLLLAGVPLLDVRAPVEFDKGAFPEAVNLPLLSDEERHLVGIRYKEQGQQSAIELGAKLLTADLRQQRIKCWVDFFEQNPNGALYCFRGGLRSRITQQWLKEAGLEIPLVKGGYKALRSYLIESLDKLCTTMDLMLIGGRTGSGKTLLVNQLGDTVDLEALAEHRGSSFGGLTNEQPRNIDFEHSVTIALLRLREAGVSRVYLEDEARLIGRVCLPDRLREAMLQAPIVILDCDMQRRIRHCFDDYVPDLLQRYTQLLGKEAGFSAFCDHHRNSLARIQKRFGGENYRHALELLEQALHQHLAHNDTSFYAEFIELLLSKYYDPMYDYQLSKKTKRVIFAGSADDISEMVSSLE